MSWDATEHIPQPFFGIDPVRDETDHFRSFNYEDFVARDKANLDIFWLKDESLEKTDNLTDPDVLAAEIVENLEVALELFRSVAEGLETPGKTQVCSWSS